MATVTRMEVLNAQVNHNTSKELSALDKRFPGCIVGFGELTDYEVIAKDDCSTSVTRRGGELVFTNAFGKMESISCH